MISNSINKNTKNQDNWKNIWYFNFDIDIFLLDYLNFSFLYEDEPNIDELKNISDKGNIEAQLILGSLYKNMKKIKDEKKANILFQRVYHHYFSLAKQDNAEAQYYLSIIYYYGFGRSRDLEKAFKWCKKSSKKEYDESLLFLGSMYEKGEGTKKDDLKAIDCYRDLAEKGNIDAQQKLAEIYFRRKEYKEAFEWYSKIDKQKYFSVENIIQFAQKGHSKAQLRLAEMYSNADGVKRDHNKAIYWLTQAGEQGNVEAQLKLADISCFINKDYNKAIFWFSKLAEQGNYNAQYSLGELYKSYIKDYDKAIYWLSQATEHELDSNKFKLKIQLDEIKDFLNLKEKANTGDVGSQIALANLFVKGFGDKDDYTKALKWYWNLLDKDNIQALYNLGLMYEFGFGIEQDFEKALNFYYKAMKQGDNEAKKRFDLIEKFLKNKKLAENGHIIAQLKLSIMYYYRKDYNNTIYWLSEAGNNENINIQNMPIEIHNMLAEIDALDITSEIVDFEVWKNGNIDIPYMLSEIYNMLGNIYSGLLLDVDNEYIALEIMDLDKTIYWYEKSAEQGDKFIQCELGYFYELKGDYSKAIYWYEKSIEQGETRGLYNLGLIYKGNKDYEKALMCFEKYANKINLQSNNTK